MYTWIKTVVQFHDVLHGFFTGKGKRTGTAIMEFKLAQELVSVDQYPIFLVFGNIRKIYDNLDHGRLLQTLAGYRVGSKLRGLLA